MIILILMLIAIPFAFSYWYDVQQFKNEVKRRKLYYENTGRRLKHSSSFKNK